jgi:hypothetical protein
MNDSERIIGRMEEFQKSAERRFDSIETKVNTLTEFKVSMIASARTTSFIVGGITGFITFAASLLVTIIFRK